LMTQALMVPYAGGGFLVRSLEPGSLYQKLGLQPGDVVQAVNGQPLRSVQQAMQIYGQLPNANAIDLQILRHGKAQDLHYLIQ
ncbi:MAG TPA: PDZ domain-containing protein, partial [Acidiferrobacteraceae bacterium]|nr:PDZ domain-containing protein [Acidiferrobacteraceae bacterium]